MKKIKLQTIRNLLFLLNQKRKIFILFSFLITFNSILEAVGIGSLYPIIDIIGQSAKKEYYLGKVNDFFNIGLSGENFILVMFLVVASIFLFKGIFLIFSYYLQFYFSENLKADWQTQIFKNYLDKQFSFFVKHQIGDLIQRQMVHTENAGVCVRHLCQMGRDLFVAFFLYLMLLAISIKATLIVTALMIFMSLMYLILSKIKIYVSSKEQAELQKKAYSIAAEVIGGIRQVKAFLGESFFMKKFHQAVQTKAKIFIRNSTMSQSPIPAMQTLVLVGAIFILFLVYKYSKNPKEVLPMVTVYLGALYRISGATASINSNLMMITQSLPSVNIITDILKEKPILKNFPVIKIFQNNIKFGDIEFFHEDGKFVLKISNLVLEKGKFYGIAGPSGSGKSTFVDLLIKFYSPQKGKITIDDKDLEKIDISSWRKQIGLISQETFIFNGTIEENISFAKNSTEIDKTRIESAAKIADIHDMIMDFPNSYKTQVGERGLMLSGGQRQRLAIARAVYRDPEIYIFDEATSSLDTHSEKKIQSAIENLRKSKTIIAIAHRLSTIKNADQIIVMNNGKIIEKGNQRELLNKKGKYSQLYNSQYRSEKNN